MEIIKTGVATYNSLLRTKINDFLKKKLKECGHGDLRPSHGAILAVVYKNNGKVQIKTIYDALRKQKTTITEGINRLVRLGYLTKEGCPNDGRCTYVVATQKALDFREAFGEISRELQEKVYEGFSQEEQENLVRLMTKAIGNFK